MENGEVIKGSEGLVVIVSYGTKPMLPLVSTATSVRKLSTLKMIWKIATTPNIQISAWLSSPVSDIVTPTAIQVLLHYLSSIFSILSTPHCNVESVALKEKSSPWRSLIYQSVEITENRKFYEISELVPIHFRQIQEPPIYTK